jgi:hypothetical protein
MLAFFSSAALVPAALVAWVPLWTFLLLWLGWIVGGIVSYFAARYLGRPLLAFAGSSRSLARWEERISRRTPFRLALLFQLAVPSEVPGIVLGLAYPPGPSRSARTRGCRSRGAIFLRASAAHAGAGGGRDRGRGGGLRGLRAHRQLAAFIAADGSAA